MTLGRTRSPRRSNRGDRQRDADREQDGMTESVVDIRRVAKTVAGGRRFTFDALVVVGDGQGSVGFGLGKAKEVPDAVQKGSSIARGAMSKVALLDSTVPQQVVSKSGGARVMLKPAAPGTGVRASAAVRAVVQAAGVRDILTKSLGSSNPVNVVRATIRGLHMMRDPQEMMALRRMVRGEPPLAPPEPEATTAPTAETETPEEVTASPTVEAETPEEETTAATAETETPEEATASPTAETETPEEEATAAEEPPTVAQEEAPPVAESTEEEPASSTEEDRAEDSAPAEESPETAVAETPEEESEVVDETRADSDDDSEEKDS